LLFSRLHESTEQRSVTLTWFIVASVKTRRCARFWII